MQHGVFSDDAYSAEGILCIEGENDK